MSENMIQLIDLVAKIAVLPVLGMVYSVQGRLSKIEGQFSALYELLKTKGMK